jgi:hypothetical protein
MHTGGPCLGQLNASLLGSPAQYWCHARRLATRCCPQGRAQVAQLGAWREPHTQDPSRTTARRASMNSTNGPLATPAKADQVGGRPYVCAAAALARSPASAALGVCSPPVVRVGHGRQTCGLRVLHHGLGAESCVSMNPMIALSMTLARPAAMRPPRCIASSIGLRQRRPISAK